MLESQLMDGIDFEKKIRRISYNQANDPTMNREESPLPEKQNPRLYAEDGCYLLECQKDDKICEQFALFDKVLRWMGLRFDPISGSKLTLGRLFWQFITVSLAIYTTMYDVYYLLKLNDKKSAPATLVSAVWMLQAVISQIFLNFWQRNLCFEKFFHTYRHAKIRDIDMFDEQRDRSIARNSRRFRLVEFYLVLTGLTYTIASFFRWTEHMMSPRYYYAFYFADLRYIRMIQATFNCTVWNIALHTYICLSNAMYWEVKKFNWKLKMLRASTSGEMAEKLQPLIDVHTGLNRSVRALDGIFKIYAFLMIATVIPTTLLTLVMVLTRNSSIGVFLSIPCVAFCIYSYYGTMITPARLHEELGKSKAALCMNSQVWVPYDKKVNKIAHTLAMHLDQADLGISLWGFAMVTKPLILTTISVMMTCLAFLLELKPAAMEERERSGNVTFSENSSC